MKLSLLIFLLVTTANARAQKVDSIYFNLYTDSLKKGSFNYINVDGKLNNGHWLPLTSKEINFTASGGSFDGNSLYIDTSFAAEKIIVKAVLKANPAITKETTMYIKKGLDNERLPTSEELIRRAGKKRGQ